MVKNCVRFCQNLFNSLHMLQDGFRVCLLLLLLSKVLLLSYYMYIRCFVVFFRTIDFHISIHDLYIRRNKKNDYRININNVLTVIGCESLDISSSR